MAKLWPRLRPCQLYDFAGRSGTDPAARRPSDAAVLRLENPTQETINGRYRGCVVTGPLRFPQHYTRVVCILLTFTNGQPMQLHLTRSPSASEVAAVLDQLAVEPLTECELTLPATFVSKMPFDYADYVQVIFTWAARSGPKVLRVHAQGAAEARAQLKGDHIQLAAALADRVIDRPRSDVTADVAEEVQSRLSKKRVIQPRAAGVRAPVEQAIIEVSRFPELASSPDLTAPDPSGAMEVGAEARSLFGWVWPRSRVETLLANANVGEEVVGNDGDKHIERRRWPDGHPYLATPGTKIPYRPLADRLVAIRPSARARTRESAARRNRAEDDLGAALFELSQNAHLHGSKDRSGSSLEHQARVLRTVTRTFDRDAARGVELSNPALAGWMNRHLDRAATDSSEMAVIDVIDNGIGLAQRAASLLGEYGDLDGRQELEYLRQALAKSTRQGSNRMSAEGLARMQFLMTNLGGAVSIRSGRLAIFRDFLRTPYSELNIGTFADWIPPENIPGRPRRRGSVMTIIIPTR